MKKTHDEIKRELWDELADKTLSFGCWIETECGEKWRYIGDCDYKEHYISEEGDNFTSQYLDGRDKIIGHEPTLNDVLLKLGEIGFYFMGDTGQFFIHNGTSASETRITITTDLTYDLKKSFDYQSENFHRILHELLYKELTT